jgi:hypothetical protein
MNAFPSRIVVILMLPAILAVTAAPSVTQDVNIGVGVASGDAAAGFQVLTTGPLHEAYARPVVYATDGVYVSSTPPELLHEVPPLERPEGAAVWVHGYWSYDDADRRWIWVSGIWRVPPPGHAWVPGYWYQTSRGWRYVSGYWAPVSGQDEIQYLPEPPDPLETEAYEPAPYADAMWVSGSWVWAGSDYSWRSGYWMRPRPDWTWVPGHYHWTPYGYVYTHPHWDRGIGHRGFLYAPVRFAAGFSFANYDYTPGFLLNVSLFSDSLFVRPWNSHYYFGDYYAPNYWGLGYYPSFAFHSTALGWDPVFAHASWTHRDHARDWLEDRRNRFRRLQAQPDARPPRTLDEVARKPMPKPDGAAGETAPVAVPSKDASKVTGLPLKTMPEAERAKVVEQTKSMLAARNERIKVETAAPAGETARMTQARTARRPAPAVPEQAAAKGAAQAPEMPELPKPEAPARGGRGAAGMEPRRLEPRIDRATDHMGRVNGVPREGDAPAREREGAKPEPVKPDAAKPVKPPERQPGRIEEQPAKQPEPQPQPPRRDVTPPPGRDVPQPPRREVNPPPPQPPRREVNPPPPQPPRREVNPPPPQPAPKPAPPPKPQGKPDGKPEGQPQGKPDGKPDGKKDEGIE